MDSKAWFAFSKMIDELWEKQQKENVFIKEMLDENLRKFIDLEIKLDKLYDKIEKLKPT